MQDSLSLYQFDVEEVLKDLRLEWEESENYPYNPTAFSRMKVVGDNIMFCCPVHYETNPSCGIYTFYPYYWHCFGCDASGGLDSLVGIAIGKSSLEGLRYLLKNYTVGRKTRSLSLDLDRTQKKAQGKFVIGEEIAQRYKKKFHPYLLRRGITRMVAEKYEVGYDDETNSIVFPVRDTKGNIRFFHRRSVLRKSFLNDIGATKKDILYGLYYLLKSNKKFQTIYVTESPIDTMSAYACKMPSIALMGRKLFREQVKELLLAGVKHLTMFMDNDREGVRGAIEAYQLLFKTPIRVDMVIYPGGQYGIDKTQMYKDANDLLMAGKMQDIQIISFEEFISSVKGWGKLL